MATDQLSPEMGSSVPQVERLPLNDGGGATHRYSKVNTSIFESQRIDFRRSKVETSHLQFYGIKSVSKLPRQLEL